MCHSFIFADPLPNCGMWYCKWNTNAFAKPNVLDSSGGPNNDRTRKKQSLGFSYPMTKSRMNGPHSSIVGSETTTTNLYNDVGQYKWA